MSEITNSATIKVTADASGVEAELRKVDTAAARTGVNLDNLGRADGISKLGTNAEVAASKFGFAGKTIIDAIQKQTLAAERGTKGTKEFYETWANQRGINPAVLKPFLDQLDSVTRKTGEAAVAQAKMDNGQKYLASLRAQAAEIGKSNSQLAEMRAAQLGVSESAAPLIAQLREAEEASSGFGGALGITTGALASFAAGLAGAVSIGAFVASVSAAIDGLADLDDMAQKTGSSVESLSRLQKVAAVAGQDFGAVDSAVSKLAKSMGGLDEDSNKAVGALKRLGISTKDLATQDPSEVLVKAAKALQNYSDGANKTALINDLLGKSGADLLPYLNDLAEGYDKYNGSTSASAAAASAFGDNMGALRVRIGELGTVVAANLLPSLVKFSEYVKELAESDRFATFIKDAGSAVVIFARAVESSISVLVPAAKIAAAYFATFVAIPAAAALASTALATLYGIVGTGVVSLIAGGTATMGLNTALFGTSVAAQLASGSLSKLALAGNLAFAAFAGWQIGTYLREEFSVVRVAGLMAVEALMLGFENLKFNLSQAFSAIKETWNGVLGEMKISFAGYIDSVAKGLSKIGAAPIADQVSKYAEGLRASGAEQVALALKTAVASDAMVKAHKATKAAISSNIAELIQYEQTVGKVSEAADRNPPKLPKGGLGKPGGAGAEAIEKMQKAYQSLTASIAEKIAAAEVEANGQDKLTESTKLLIALEKQLESGRLKLLPLQEKKYRADIALLAVQEQIIASNIRARKAGEDWAKMEKALSDAASKAVEDAMREAAANERLAETFGMTKSAIEALELARLEEQLAQRSSNAMTLSEIETLEQLIAAKKRSAAALSSVDSKEAAKKANTEMLSDWQKTVDKYDDVFRNGFADMLNNGKDGWKSFTKSLITTFKTSVADQIYKMFAQPLVMQFVGSMAGSGGAAGAAGSIGGGQAGAAQWLAAGKSIYSAFSTAASSGGGLAGFGKSLVGSVTSAFSGAGATAGATGAASGTGAAAGASGGIGASGAIPIVGWIAAGMALSNSLYKKGWDAQNGSLTDSYGGKAIMPFNAPMLHLNKGLQKLGMSNSLANMFSGASTVSRLFGRKNPEVTSSGVEGMFGAEGFAGKTYQNILEKGGVFRSDKKYTNSQALDAGTDSTFDDTFKTLLASVKGFGAAMGIEAGQIDGYTKAIKLTLTDDVAKNDEAIAGVFGDIGNDLAKLLVPTIDALANKGESAAAALQRITTNYVVMDEALAAIGDTFGSVGIGSIDARERLVELTGGIEAFSKGAAFFAQNYLSQAEQTEALAKKVETAFAEIGVSGITTRDQFKQLVLGLDLASVQGATTYAGLMNIQEAFAQLTPQIEEAAASLTYLKELRQQEIQIMELAGDTAGALAASRALEIEGLDAVLRPGQERINKLKDEADALALANSVRNEALAIQAQIYELTGNKAGAAAILQQQHIAALAALDPALRSATETLYGLEAAAQAVQGSRAAADALLSGVDDAYAVLQRIASTEKDRATVAHNLTMARLQESIDAEATAIATRKTQAAAAINSTKALSDAIRSSLSQMSIAGSEGQARASAQAQVRTALAITRAGGPLPGADSIKDALSTLAQDSSEQFATMQDYLRDAYRTKADVAALGALSDSALSIQEQALKVLEDQKSELQGQKEAALLAYQGEISRLDSIVAGAQQQIDVLKGIDTTGLSIVQGLEAVRLAIVAAAANPVAGALAPINEAYKESLGRAPDRAGMDFWQNSIASGVSTAAVVGQIANSMEAKIQALYKDLLGRSADSAGLDYFIKSGASIDTISANIVASEEYKKKLRGFAVGTNLVPYDMPAMVHEGERIIPAADNRELMQRLSAPAGNDSARLERLVEGLTAEVQRLQLVVAEGNANTRQLAEQFDNVTEGGNAIRSEVMA